MRLSELIAGGPASAPLPTDPEIVGLSADSREIRPGYLFAALSGVRHEGSAFIADAVGHGAVAVLAEPGAAAKAEAARVAFVADPNPRHRLAMMAARFFARQPETVAAITGTNGKTSVANFTRQIWLKLERRAASVGTLGVIANGHKHELHHTTPDPVSLHAALAALADEGVTHLALEASSHGLDQCRLDGVRIAAACFTNLTRDHFDYHPNVEAYFKAKARLFEVLLPEGGAAVINAEAPEAARLSEACRARRHRLLRFGARGCEIALIERREEGTGQALLLDVLGQRREVFYPLPGAFQACNLLAALGLAIGTGESVDAVLGTIESLTSVRGRLELVGHHSSGAPVYIDYAHTPDGLETVLRAMRPYARNRLAVVFGCGGDRDKGKRPLMGQVAAALAERAIVTDDNPRTEDAGQIRREILAECPGAMEIGDRRRAIEAAVASLEAGDVLIIAGKGHEEGQLVGATEIPFDDASVAREALTALGGEVAA